MMAWYDKALKQLSIAYTSGFVSTRYGDTHVIAAGRPDAPALVLVHALNANALMWVRELTLLSRDYRVYAPDVIGMSGWSAPARLSYKGTGYAEWLTDVLDALQVEQASMIGMSFGGWLVLKFGARHPQRVTRAVLLSSAGFMPVRLRYRLPLSPAMRFMNDAKAHRLARAMLAPAGLASDDSADEFLYLTLKHCKHQSEAPALPDKELRRMQVPTLLLMAEHEAVWNPHAVIAKARRLLPHIQTELVPNAGHAITINQPAVVLEHVMKFLKDG